MHNARIVLYSKYKMQRHTRNLHIICVKWKMQLAVKKKSKLYLYTRAVRECIFLLFCSWICVYAWMVTVESECIQILVHAL